MSSEERQIREAFNHLAEEWDERSFSSPDKIRYLLSFLTIPPSSTVLDVGSGTGVLIPFLRERIGPSGLIVELDIAEEMLRVAREKFGEEGIEYHQGSAERYSFNHRYDLIIVYSSFPHFGDEDLALRNLIFHLKERGELAIAHSESRETINQRHRGDGAPRAFLLPPGEELAQELKKQGLEIIQVIDDQELYLVVGRK
ncbi:MAG: hypothetical protein PWP57_1116 [Candidatus Atribacteria bacterium]|nr:hypothetical protein [Candidatus Atribacteria bacterium]